MRMSLFTFKRTFVATIVCVCLIASTTQRTAAEPAKSSVRAKSVKSEPSKPLSVRFADSDATEVPDFQKHVVPLMGRLGCNGRSCHGSFQGRGGFQLSLFGYDFQGDHEALLDDATGRVDVDDIEESLILAKPSDADMHEGGKRFDKDSWQYNVLRQWISSGANYPKESVQKLLQLEVTPAEVLFTKENENIELRAIAHWEDGSSEDVTELCRFSSNDDAIAEIDALGQVKSGDQGDTHVVVYYDNAVVPVPVLRPIGPASSGRPQSQPIDQLVQQKLDKLGIVSSANCTDAEFIRRVSLDITGILPSADTVRSFLADTSSDKRERLVDQLLDSPGYAAWWATRFSDWTGNSAEQLNNVLPVRNAATRLWHEWLRSRLESNMPYDEIVAGIVTAESRQPDEGYVEYCKKMTEACQPGNESQFADRDGLPMFWARRNFQKPEDRAIGFAYTFLGVRIECAQCHKHPFDQWSKNDFEEFAKVFSIIRYSQNQVAPDAKKDRDELLEQLTGGKKLRGGDLRKAVYKAAQEGKAVPFGELVINNAVSERAKKARALAKRKGRKAPEIKIPTGKILGQSEPLLLDKDPRDELMAWLRSEENPYFAKAIVNRVWSNYFGAGIVDPTDDMNLANPPVNAPLLDYLSREFIQHDFDLKWLHRAIVTSETYQRSSDTNETNMMDRANFSHHVPRRLPAEVVYDAVVLATGSDQNASQLRGELTEMAIAEGKPRQRNQQDFALEVFGQSIRESNCDCDRSNSPSLLQSIYLRNDADMHKRLSDRDGWVAQACAELGVAGPKSANDPKTLANQRRAEGYRKQFLNRIRQFKTLPESKRGRMREQLKKEHARLVSRFKPTGYHVPSLKSLLQDPSDWDSLEKAPTTAPGTTTMESLVEEAYLRTLSRFPDSEETDISVAFINESESPADGVQSLVWALVNTKEFIITH
ncbi:MAG: DUF1549 and DUF1553 domain-containing protein [Rubripirellula sp.]